MSALPGIQNLIPPTPSSRVCRTPPPLDRSKFSCVNGVHVGSRIAATFPARPAVSAIVEFCISDSRVAMRVIEHRDRRRACRSPRGVVARRAPPPPNPPNSESATTTRMTLLVLVVAVDAGRARAQLSEDILLATLQGLRCRSLGVGEGGTPRRLRPRGLLRGCPLRRKRFPSPPPITTDGGVPSCDGDAGRTDGGSVGSGYPSSSRRDVEVVVGEGALSFPRLDSGQHGSYQERVWGDEKQDCAYVGYTYRLPHLLS